VWVGGANAMSRGDVGMFGMSHLTERADQVASGAWM
jgi:hypothetical protein